MALGRSPKAPVFLEKASYRQRRLRDAARLLPIVGLVLWMLPLTWSEVDGADGGASSALIYIFGVWVLLIVLAAVFSRHMGSRSIDEEEGDSKP